MATIFWRDLDITFQRANDGDVKTLINTDAINSSLTNIFSTLQGSRRMIPEFAMDIYRLLFEPIDDITANRIGEIFLDGVQRWEPRIVIEGLKIVAKPDQNIYSVFLNYYIGTTGGEERLFTFEYILRAV